jgi:hypothetical protein
MPNPFSITAAADSVSLDSQGRGSTTFTVSNTSGRPRRGRAKLVPADPGQASWLSVAGEAERDFATDGTQQYTVQIATPPGTPPGRHTFGLDVVSVENPDEEWSQGPKVAFEVPAPPPKKPFPWWILLVVLALLLVGGVVIWLLLRDGEPEKVALMGACTKDEECMDGLACLVETPGQPGFCVGKPGFSPCTSARQCNEGLTCQEKTCRGGPQTACDDRNDCLQGMACANGTCRGEKGFSVCAQKEDCTDGLFCVNGSCVGETVLQLCESDAQCVPGESCVQVDQQRFCLRQTGQACTKPFDCVSRTCGADSKCQQGRETCLTNADCLAPAACSGGNCLLPNGQACTDNLKCQSGNCSDGQCAAVPIPCGPDRACPSRRMDCVNNVCVMRPFVFGIEHLEQHRFTPHVRVP